MKAMNYMYEVDNEVLRVFAIPYGNGYTLGFYSEEKAPKGSKELYSKYPLSMFYGVDPLLKGIVIEPLMISQMETCNLIKDDEKGFKECEMVIPVMGTVLMGTVDGDFEDVENISLSSEQKFYMLNYLGYEKQMEVSEWFEECQKHLCVRVGNYV